MRADERSVNCNLFQRAGPSGMITADTDLPVSARNRENTFINNAENGNLHISGRGGNRISAVRP